MAPHESAYQPTRDISTANASLKQSSQHFHALLLHALVGIRLLGQLSEADRKHYPGRGGVVYVINTPPLFGVFWKGIYPFVEATKVKHLTHAKHAADLLPFLSPWCTFRMASDFQCSHFLCNQPVLRTSRPCVRDCRDHFFLLFFCTPHPAPAPPLTYRGGHVQQPASVQCYGPSPPPRYGATCGIELQHYKILRSRGI